MINRDKKGRKGSIVALIKGTKAEDVIKVLMLIDIRLRNMVKEITLDMANSMQKLQENAFLKPCR